MSDTTSAAEAAAAEAVANPPAAAAADAADADADDEEKEEKDLSPDFAPVVELTEVEVKTGEEDEIVIFKIRSKLFRFDKEMQQWKERGTGDVRLLQHKENKKIRILMRREKTLKICLNHFVNKAAELTENVGSDRSWVFHAVDYADGERDEAMLAIRFASSENATLFKKFYDAARAYMGALIAGDDLPELPVQEVSTEPKGENVADAPAKTIGDAKVDVDAEAKATEASA
jgi:Ran-binding protein 1